MLAPRNDSEQPEAIKRYWKLEMWGQRIAKENFHLLKRLFGANNVSDLVEN